MKRKTDFKSKYTLCQIVKTYEKCFDLEKEYLLLLSSFFSCTRLVRGMYEVEEL